MYIIHSFSISLHVDEVAQSTCSHHFTDAFNRNCSTCKITSQMHSILITGNTDKKVEESLGIPQTYLYFSSMHTARG